MVQNFITATICRVLSGGFLKFRCCVKEKRLLMRIFRQYCAVPDPITFSTRFPRLYIYIRGSRLVTDGVLIRAECISRNSGDKKIGSQRQTLVSATKRRARIRFKWTEKRACIPISDGAFHCRMDVPHRVIGATRLSPRQVLLNTTSDIKYKCRHTYKPVRFERNFSASPRSAFFEWYNFKYFFHSLVSSLKLGIMIVWNLLLSSSYVDLSFRLNEEVAHVFRQVWAILIQKAKAICIANHDANDGTKRIHGS